MYLTQIGLAVSMVLFQGQAADESKDAKPTAKQIQTAVERLGSVSPGERKKAARILWNAGRAAEAALKKAANSKDPELQFQAQQILDKMKYGIFPDTPPEVVALIERYRKGDRNVRLVVVRELKSKGRIDTLFRLFDAETDESLRQQFGRLFGDEMVRNWLVQGKQKQAVQWLRQQALFDGSSGKALRDYASWVLVGGNLDSETKRLKKEVEEHADRSRMRMLACLLRLRGELKAAKTVAEKSGDRDLLVDVLYDQRDWKELTNFVPGDQGVERLGFSAAFHRLAGHRKEVERALKGLDDRAKTDPRWAYWMHGEALMINNEWKRTVDLFSKHQPGAAFDLLCLQLRFSEAFKLVGIADPRTGTAKWFAGRAAGLKLESREMTAHFRLGLSVVRVLLSLGEKKEAVRLLDEVAKYSKDKSGYRLGQLYKTESRFGLNVRARNRVAPSLGDTRSGQILHVLFWKQRAEAEVWWEFLRREASGDSIPSRLARLERILAPAPAEAADRIDLGPLAKRAEQLCRKMDSKDRIKWLDAIVKTCQRHRMDDLVVRYSEQLAGLSPTVETLLQAADAHARKKSWKKAAIWYDKAWQRNRTQSLALYLHGHALAKIGEKKKSIKLIELADRLPLGDHNRRRELADGLESRGLKREAEKHWKLMVQIGPFNRWESRHAWSVQHAAQQLGNAVRDRDPLLAADCWERVMFYCLKTNASLSGVHQYAHVVHLVHKQRAIGLFKAGRTKPAVREVWLAYAASPGGPRLVEDLLPVLEKARQKPVADNLFATAYESRQRVCREFPKAASHHNNLAWMAARCGRRLDGAVKHAERAVALAPKNPSYLDTLAEVHFQRGNRPKAIESARQAVALAPKNRLFRERLKRFEKAATPHSENPD